MTFQVGQAAIVVDASVAVSALRAQLGWESQLRGWIESNVMLLAPAHFGHEVANALLRGLPEEAADAEELLEQLFVVGIETADRGRSGLLGSMRLARRHGLTIYDAAYLDLALDVDAALATLDRDLAAAAARERVAVIG